VAEAVENAHRAWIAWADTPVFKRAEIISRAADVLETRTQELALTMTYHTDKRIAESKGEIARSLSTLRISAEEAKWIMGVVAGISPFNAPMNTVCHKLGPALAAGNALVGHPLVEVVNFTGSGRVADQIIRQVGLKRVLLELGGNAATIVHKDANLKAAMKPGDPLDPATGIGPMINEDAARRVEQWIQEAVREAARLVSPASSSASGSPRPLPGLAPASR